MIVLGILKIEHRRKQVSLPLPQTSRHACPLPVAPPDSGLWPLGHAATYGPEQKWTVDHPQTLSAWPGACIRIPCKYRMPASHTKTRLDNILLFQNYSFTEGKFQGTVLYNNTKTGNTETELYLSQQDRVTFLGNRADNCTLKIHPIHATDTGILGLRLTSGTEKWMEKIHLNVSKKPFPPDIHLPSEIREYQSVTLTCGLNFACFGYDINLKWSLEESEITSITSSVTSSVENVSTQSKLTFQPKWTDNGKSVKCQVQHASEVLSEKTERLDVKYTPKLKIGVNPTEVKEGNSVIMTCQVISSNPKLGSAAVSWFKDGRLLQEQELDRDGDQDQTATLTLHSVTKDMRGKYQCRASNDIGEGESEEVALTVLYAPEPSRVHIYTSPAEEGQSVELICESLASPRATNYTWYHNRKAVPGHTQEKLQLPKVSLWHAGNYSCSAENYLGRGEIHQEAELDVHYTPRNVTTVIQSFTPVREGDSVMLVCRYNSSNPVVTSYQWSPPGSGSELKPGVLRIQKVTWDSVPVKCAACNYKCSWALPVSLNVHYAPRDVKVLKVSPTSEIRAGQHVLLQCGFSGSHPAEVRFFWKKNGSLVQEGRDLSFSSISPEDSGNYNCMVNNSVGETSSRTWSLQVLYAPRRLRVSISPKDSVMEGKKATLSCESDANPPIFQYTWFDSNGQDLHFSGQKLRLEPLRVQHSGSYRCQGTNELGVGESPPTTLTVYLGRGDRDNFSTPFYITLSYVEEICRQEGARFMKREGQGALSVITRRSEPVYLSSPDSPETIGKRVALGLGFCLAICILAIWGMKIQKKWKHNRSQQGLQENSSGQSFFVRNKKARRTPLLEGPQSQGCYNLAMDDTVSYAVLRFPESNAHSSGDAGTPATQGPPPNDDDSDTVTYSVVQKRHMGDYENVSPSCPEDESIHYSELVQFGAGKRPQPKEEVDYVTLKH
ncbi:B-cell receptor CD22 [Apodemus speciosus]|uniref:B-cell receptor CD22 n=1 Tax=Apodemus speciosus TaxID=105296 RepID=A0ABQ0EYB3_APOSI